MKSEQLASGPAPEQPTQAEIDKWASRTAWKLIVRGVGLGVVYSLSRAIANNFNDAMGGSPSDFRRKRDK